MISPAFGRATSAEAARANLPFSQIPKQQLLKRGLLGGRIRSSTCGGLQPAVSARRVSVRDYFFRACASCSGRIARDRGACPISAQLCPHMGHF